jgi:hypothetical protein
MIEMLAAAKKSALWPTDCPFINDVIVHVFWWLL